MTEVYVSVPTEKEDRYESNEVARRQLLGPLSTLLRLSGVDDTYSVFKPETRRRWYAWITTPLSLAIIIALFYHTTRQFKRMENALSWEWAEVFTLSGLALLSFASALSLAAWTRSLFFLDFFNAWLDAGRQTRPVPRDACRSVLCLLCLLFFVATAVLSTTKYAVHRGYGMVANASSDSLLLEQLHSAEPLFSLWGALLSALALALYGTLHGIAAEQIADFNLQLKEASDAERMEFSLDSLASRHAAVVSMVRLLSRNVSTFAMFSAVAGIISNFCAMFLSIIYSTQMSGLSNACVLLWTIVAITTCAVTLTQPSRLQKLLNEGVEILLSDTQVWKGKAESAQLAQSMVSRVRLGDSAVTLFSCLRLTQWSGHAIMMLPPIVGGVLICIKLYA